MRHASARWAVLVCVWCLPAGISAGEKQAKSIVLFNGKDLSAWTFFLSKPSVKMADVWSVSDGVLVCKGVPSGYLRTKTAYANYRLTLQWRWAAGKARRRNSGVLLHTSGKDRIWPKSIEAQLMAGNAGDFYTIGGTSVDIPNAEKRKRGRRHINLTDNSEKKIGEWNTMDITCKGGQVTVKVNGDLVNDGSNASVTKGAICLQSEGAEIHFRKIVLTPLVE